MFINEPFKLTFSTKVHFNNKKPRRMAGLFSMFVFVQEGIQAVSPRSGQGQNQESNEIQ